MGLIEDIQVSAFPFLGSPASEGTALYLIANVQAVTFTSSSVYSYVGTRLNASFYNPQASPTQGRLPPETSVQAPQEAVITLILFALSLYIGKQSLNGVEGAIKRAIATDKRLSLEEVLLSDGTIQARVLLLEPPQLIYNGQYPYDGTYAYG